MNTTVGRLGKVLMFMFSLILSGCIPRATVPAVDIQILSLREHYDDALTVAREWQSDAYLQSANAIARLSNDSHPPLRLSYSFLSQSKRSQSLLVFIREDSTVDSEVVSLGGSVEDRREIQSDQWKLDSMDAVRLAQEAGGNEYISRYGPVRMTAFLEYRKQESADIVIWRVSFLRLEAAENFVFELDAINGDVLELRE